MDLCCPSLVMVCFHWSIRNDIKQLSQPFPCTDIWCFWSCPNSKCFSCTSSCCSHPWWTKSCCEGFKYLFLLIRFVMLFIWRYLFNYHIEIEIWIFLIKVSFFPIMPSFQVQHTHMTDSAAADYATVELIVNTLHRFFPSFDYRSTYRYFLIIMFPNF